jgi:DNA-binding PadR family transcriptional regulator
VSVPMCILAILDERPAYGLQLKNEFEARTGAIWPLNVGQVYTTLARLERDGLVRQREASGDKTYVITAAGRRRLRDWLTEASERPAPDRDELVLKLVMSVGLDHVNVVDVIQAERKAAVRQLQDYTRLKRDADGDETLGWHFLIDSLIFQAEARVRWLDACEARLHGARVRPRRAAEPAHEETEVRR